MRRELCHHQRVNRRPQILLVDLPEEADNRLRARGRNVQRGSLGQLWKVDADARLLPVDLSQADLPNRTEGDIIVLDFEPEVQTGLPPVTWPPNGERGFFQSLAKGAVDFRPRVAAALNPDWQRIYDHGGVFCIFADQAQPTEYIFGEQLPHRVNELSHWQLRLWDILDPLKELDVTSDQGSDIRPTDPAEELGVASLLRGEFTCTVRPTGQQEKRWLPLAENRWGASVAGVLFGEGDEGLVVVLPHVEDKASVIEWVVDDLAPRFRPKLFPDSDQARWRQSTALELVAVGKLRAEVAEVRQRAEEAEATLMERIDAARSEQEWLLDLLDGTDEVLVDAVACALRVCGLEDVRNADEELAAADPGADRREDLQIHDRSPLVLVEVKGITRPRPREAEALQVSNYIAPRMRATGRHDVVGLTVINHERHLPPEARADDIFVSDVVISAEERQIGLLRSVDLYRLARGVVEYGWPPDTVCDRFWKPGLLDGRPEHHEPLGRVINVFDEQEVIAVELTAALGRGNRIALELPIYTVELEATSLQQDRREVDHAGPGEHVAIHVGELANALRKGMPVLFARGPV